MRRAVQPRGAAVPLRIVLCGAHADGRATNSPGIGSGNRHQRLRLSGPG
ncbi:chaplin family protein [Streptomyces lydicus]